eukprot:Polyplicarium_translucidae@DN2335_c0_g1_i1.p1
MRIFVRRVCSPKADTEMGKNRHSKDKLYLVASEHARDWGGYKKRREGLPFRVLPFHCCALSLSPFTNPVSTKDGIVFDIDNIIPYIKKFRRNPVDASPLTPKGLIPLRFHKNADGEYHCPVTFKVFTGHSHIVANAKSGHVYINEAIDRLCRKPASWLDPMTSQPFAVTDLIDIQNPRNLEPRKIEDFSHMRIEPDTSADDSTIPSASASSINAGMAPVIVESGLMQNIMTAAKAEAKERVLISSFDDIPTPTMSAH